MSTLNSVDMLRRLVAFPTVSRDSNLPLIDWVEDYLGQFGARCRRRGRKMVLQQLDEATRLALAPW